MRVRNCLDGVDINRMNSYSGIFTLRKRLVVPAALSNSVADTVSASCVSSTKTARRTSSRKHGRPVLSQLWHGSSAYVFSLREEFVAPIPEAERGDIVLAYHAQLNSEDDETRLRAARAWTKWEMWTSKLHVDPKQVAEADDNEWSKYVCSLPYRPYTADC